MNRIKKFDKFVKESVGEYETNFVDVNIDETELEDSDKPNLGKLKQKSGKVIIENKVVAAKSTIPINNKLGNVFIMKIPPINIH